MHAGGLGGYGSGDSDDERSDRGSESSDTDDEELRHRIRQKQEAFWRKEREQQLLLEKQLEGRMCVWFRIDDSSSGFQPLRLMCQLVP